MFSKNNNKYHDPAMKNTFYKQTKLLLIKTNIQHIYKHVTSSYYYVLVCYTWHDRVMVVNELVDSTLMVSSHLQ